MANNEAAALSVKLGAWCSGCGRERDENGRCPNCDAWWMSPLLVIGGPLIAVSLLASSMLFAFTASIRTPQTSPVVYTQATGYGNRNVSIGAIQSAGSPYYFANPTPSPAAPHPALAVASTPIVITSPPNREAILWERHYALREMSHAAVAAIHAADLADEQQQASRFQSAPAKAEMVIEGPGI